MLRAIKEWIDNSLLHWCITKLGFIDNRTVLKKWFPHIDGLDYIELEVVNYEPFKIVLTHHFSDGTKGSVTKKLDDKEQGIVVIGISHSAKVFYCHCYSNFLTPKDVYPHMGYDGEIAGIDFVPVVTLSESLLEQFRSFRDPFPMSKLMLVNRTYR